MASFRSSSVMSIGMGKRQFLPNRRVEAVDHLDGGKHFRALGKPDVRHPHPVDGADQHAGLSRAGLRLVELAIDRQRNLGPGRNLDLDRLKETWQWSAPLKLPAANRSRWQDAVMPVVYVAVAGRAASPRRQATRTLTLTSCRQLAAFGTALGLPDSGWIGPLSQVVG